MSILVKGPNGKRVALLHFPKTSGTWARETLRAVEGIEVMVSPCRNGWSRYNGAAAWQGDLPDDVFTMTRDPFEWVRSWWRYNETHGWPSWELGSVHPCRWSDDVIAEIGHDRHDFEAFVEGILTHAPSEVNAMYENLTWGCNHIYKMENGAKMLEAVCGAVGCPVSASVLVSLLPPQNESQRLETPITSQTREEFQKLTQTARRIHQKAI